MRTGSQLIYTFAMVTTQVLAVCMQLPEVDKLIEGFCGVLTSYRQIHG